MTIPVSFFPYIDLVLILIAVFAIIDGYMHGLLLMLLNIASLFAAIFLAWWLSPAIASQFPLYPKSTSEFGEAIGELIYQKLNAGLWFILIFIGVMLLTVLLRPLVKLVGKVPLIKQTNKILGAVFGLLQTAFWLLVLTFVLSTPLFPNGKAAIEASWLKPFSLAGNQVLGVIGDQLGESVLVQRIISGQPLTQDELDDITEWLIKNNIDQDAIDDFIEKIR
ncbi:MAG: CvpA family protein [Erysipelotrichaceae bacterium]|nr:CvpA family protein [Erysipelotrichaceae bacterium]